MLDPRFSLTSSPIVLRSLGENSRDNFHFSIFIVYSFDIENECTSSDPDWSLGLGDSGAGE